VTVAAGCQHVLDGRRAAINQRVYCGKPAKFWLAEYGWKLCGIHARLWENRGLVTTELT